MSFSKKILKSEHTQGLLSWLVASYIRLVYFTSFKTRMIDPATLPYMRGEQNAVFAFWHGRMMMMPTIEPPKRTMYVLISLHRDGKLISRAIGHFGEITVSGSSSRGGKEAVSEILQLLEAGNNVSMTPDGPRGPAQVAAKGIAAIARLSGKPVIPVAFSSSRAVRFKSWTASCWRCRSAASYFASARRSPYLRARMTPPRKRHANPSSAP